MTDEELGKLLTQKHRRKMRTRNIIVLLVIIGFVIFMVLLTRNSKHPDYGNDKEIYEGNHRNAFYTSQEFAKKYLKAPSTAEFPSWYDQTTNVVQKPGSFTKYTINSYVDAQNAFGAMIREYYVCEVEYIKTRDTWRLIDFKFK